MTDSVVQSPSVEARGRVEAKIANLLSSAEIERVVWNHYQPMVDEFTAPERDNTRSWDIVLIRAVVDAKSNAERFEKEAADLRTVLSALGEAERERDLLREIRDERGMQLVNHMLRLDAALSEASTWRERAERAEGALSRLADWPIPGGIEAPLRIDMLSVIAQMRMEARAVLTGLGGEGDSSGDDRALTPQEVQHGASEASGKEGGQ